MPKISFYLYIFIFLLAPSVSSQEEVEQEIPAEILFKDVKRYGFSISPNGKFFSEIITNNVQNDIVVVDIDGYKLLNQIPMEERDIEAVHWITNSRLLYESRGAIYAIDVDGTNKKKIVDRRSDVKQKGRYAYFRGMRYNNLLSTLPSKEHLILIETYDLELNSSIKEVNRRYLIAASRRPRKWPGWRLGPGWKSHAAPGRPCGPGIERRLRREL